MLRKGLSDFSDTDQLSRINNSPALEDTPSNVLSFTERKGDQRPFSDVTGSAFHSSEALDLNQSFSLLQRCYHASLAALNHVQVGVCIAQADGEIIIVNNMAERIFDARESLWLSAENKLVADIRQTTTDLKQAIDRATMDSVGNENRNKTLISIQRSSALRPLLVEVTTISESPNLNHASALICIIDPENPYPLKIERFASQCNLSRAESLVCEGVARGRSNNHIANDRCVTLETIKSQIASVFSKTGVKNRSELVRLILNYSPPLS